jgi:hypothetical protein
VSPAALDLIDNHQVVLDWFGCWPSFHDGEVHRIVLDRMTRDHAGSFVPLLEVDVRGWLLQQLPSGELDQRHDAVVSLRFERVSHLVLEGFNHQNVITSLKLEHDGDLLVEFEHCYLFSSSFRAQKARVLKVTPWPARAIGR